MPLIFATLVAVLPGTAAAKLGGNRVRARASTGVDWSARWIGRNDPRTPPFPGQQAAAPLLRKEFRISGRVATARLHIAGLGYYVAWIDGRRVGDQVLDPGPTQYASDAVSRSFDVTELLRRGENAIGVMLGRSYFAETAVDTFGWGSRADRHEPRLLAQIDVTYRDGSTARIVTDGTWQMTDGPITDDLYFGEHYDARREQPGWTTPRFDASSWTPAPVQPSPTAHVVETTMQPIRITDTLAPVAISTPKSGVRVYDFGGQHAGWARIAVRGTAGTTVTLMYGETLNADGTVFLQDTPPGHVDTYTLKGADQETWEPSFTRHPLHYIEVSFSPDLPRAFSITARVNHNDVERTGSFASSNGLLNRIEANQVRTVLDNLWGFPTDTPWRDRQGWTADAWLYMDSAIDNFDMRGFYEQWLQAYRDSQARDGTLPVIAPAPRGGLADSFANDPSWSGTLIFDAWQLYQHYGDRSFVSDNYDTAKRWMDLLASNIARTGGVYTGFSFGDWAAPGSENGTDGLLAAPEGSGLTAPGVPLPTANADLYEEARTLARMARTLGKTADALVYDALAGRIERAFNATFFDATTNTYQNGRRVGYRQTSNVVALFYGLVPAEHERAVYVNLIADIHGRGDHLNTGAIGTKMLLHVLTAHGDTDLAYRIATQTTYPSWGYWISQGANTSWETWSHTGGFLSEDHAFLGTLNDWLYHDLAGVRPAAPGFVKVLVRPSLPTGLDHASATIATTRGPVTSSWHRGTRGFVIHVDLPGDTTAEVDVPLVTDGRIRVRNDHGVEYVRTDPGSAVYTVDGGRHDFVVTA